MGNANALGNPNPMAGAPDPGSAGSLAAPPAQPVQPAQQGAPAEGPTKAHKLLQILQGGIQGALAGRASSEQALIQSGGHRSGGAGMGFQAGYELPWQHAMQGQQLEQAKAQTALTQSQSQLIDTPMGKMPPGLAKVIFPSLIGAQSKKDVQGQKSDTAETIAGGKNQTATDVANIKAGTQRYKPIPGIGMFDTQTRQVMPGTANGITITPEIAKDHNLPDEFIGKPMKLTDLSGLQRSENQQETTVQGAAGPALVNKKTGNTRTLGLGSPGVASKLAGGVQVADDANPGNTKYTSMGNAIQTGAAGPQSASVQVPRTAAKAEVPTKIGDLKVGFNTAVQHADLLRQAAKEMKNGNVRTLANLSNRAQTEFGDPALTNFDAIANAYNHEVTSVISKGHITDAEVAKGGGTLPSGANYETIDKVLNSYQSLMQSKMNMLNQQKNAAVSGSQKKPSGGTTSGGLTAADMLKKYPPK
jgi:hypothetical protein